MKTDLATTIKSLNRQGITHNVLRQGKRAALVLPGYGRVLGLWPDAQQSNSFWVNQEFLNGQCANKWINPGGHRIWLAPECEFFISDLRRPFETYTVPAAMDPGDYTCNAGNSFAQLHNAGVLWSHTKQVNAEFTMMRKIALLGDEKLSPGKGLEAAGYEDIIEVSAQNCPVGIWSLIQVPLEGVISLPVSTTDSHTQFFGKADNLVEYDNGLLKLHLTPKPGRDFKIGLKASNCRDVITCMHTFPDGSASLVVNEFELSSDDAYIDTPWNEPDDKGYAVQFFCGGNYGFGEVEVHAPVLESKGCFQSRIKMTVQVFTGSISNCRRYAHLLCAPENESKSGNKKASKDS